MTPLEYTLIHLIEEAAEVQKAATKALRFGLEEINQKTGNTRKQDIVCELYDISAIKRILEEEFNFPLPTERFIESQQAKGEAMFQLAVNRRIVTP